MIRQILKKIVESGHVLPDSRIAQDLEELKVKEQELLKKTQGPDELPKRIAHERGAPFFTILPGVDCSSPRDGEKILQSVDSMFLAMLLHRSHGIKQVIEVQDVGGTWRYFPDVVGAEDSLVQRGMTIKSRLNCSSLRGRFKDSFLVFRKWVSGKEPTIHDHFIGDTKIRPSDSLGDKALWKLGARLNRPFSEQEDPLIDNLHQVPLFTWLPPHSETPPPLKKGEFYCPLDGPVIPMKGRERTPEYSWEIMCGREWNLSLCPKCLGVFDSRLGRMN